MSMVIVWLIVCGLAIVLELVTPSALISIWFAVGGAIGALAALVNLPLWAQIVCFLCVSLISMMIVRPIATRYLRGNVVATNADRCIGAIGIVTQTIQQNEWGEVKISGSLWHAVSIENDVIEEHVKVKVVAIEGAKLLVKRVS